MIKSKKAFREYVHYQVSKEYVYFIIIVFAIYFIIQQYFDISVKYITLDDDFILALQSIYRITDKVLFSIIIHFTYNIKD